jgi:hypothetical protein
MSSGGGGGFDFRRLYDTYYVRHLLHHMALDMTPTADKVLLEWLVKAEAEQTIEPGLPIIDPHHHLWIEGAVQTRFLLDEAAADFGSGHNIEQTCFVECHSVRAVHGLFVLRSKSVSGRGSRGSSSSRGRGRGTWARRGSRYSSRRAAPCQSRTAGAAGAAAWSKNNSKNSSNNISTNESTRLRAVQRRPGARGRAMKSW